MLWIKCWKFSSLVPIINDQISIKKKKRRKCWEQAVPIVYIKAQYNLFHPFWESWIFINSFHYFILFTALFMILFLFNTCIHIWPHAHRYDISWHYFVLIWHERYTYWQLLNLLWKHQRKKKKKKNHNLIVVILFRNNAIVRL